VARSAAIV